MFLTGGAIHVELEARTAELAVLFVEIGAVAGKSLAPGGAF